MRRESIVTLREIGRGGFGIVEAVWPTADAHQPVARKRLTEWAQKDHRLVARFKREVRLLQSLRHPNIITVLDSELATTDPFFVMPLAEYSLAQYIATHSSLNDEQVVSVFLPVLKAMEYAHAKGVLHRDLKPENILWMAEGRWVVSDFGLGRDINSNSVRLTVTGAAQGTEGYSAPEQWNDFASADQRADVYGLGSLLFEMTTGNNPLARDIKEVPTVFRGLVNRCRAFQPDYRYSTVSDLRADFESLFEEDELQPRGLSDLELLLADPTQHTENAAAIIDIYLGNLDDKELCWSTIHLWSAELFQEVADENPEGLQRIVEAVCVHIDSSVPFSFLDVIASFIRNAYDALEDPIFRDYCIRQLLVNGERFNRWYLGQTFAALAGRPLLTHEAVMFRAALRDLHRPAIWAEDYVRDQVQHKLVLRGMDEARRKLEEEKLAMGDW